MKKLICLILVTGLLLATAGIAFAQSGEVKNGEFSVMYYGGSLSGSGTDGMDTKTAPGYVARFNYFVGGPIKLGLDYATNTNNTNDFSNKINDMRIHVKYAPWRTETYNFGIGLFYNSLRFDSMGEGATFTGLGAGVDGKIKMSQKTDFYGLIDLSPSLKGSLAGVDTKLSTTTFEFGFNFHTQESMMIKAGYRSNAIKNKTTANSDVTLSGFVIGFGFDF
ncbi:MAG: outer membrane beta-barrel protein [Candidatus Eremiobacteraeota bacterium]|nr:outer membrane beta-barrel protein [Candidatus Eremiobacteraeota bacterium]